MTDETKAADLRRMKRFATAMFVAALVLFVITTIVGHDGWVGYVQAFAEAAMVGALADWFAVTALFRHPLALPIPHTAIIPKRKDQIGRTLGEFVQGEFLTPAVIAERVRGFGVGARLGTWLADEPNAARATAAATDALRAGLEVIDDDRVSAGLESAVERRLRTINVTPVLNRALIAAVEGGHHQAALDSMMRATGTFLSDNRDTLRTRLAQESPWWVPESIDDRIFAKIFDAVQRFLGDVGNDPTHELRASLTVRLDAFARRLVEDPELIARAETIKHEALDHPEVRAWLRSLWGEAKRALHEAADDDDSELRRQMVTALRSVGEQIRDDAELQGKVDDWVERAASYVADRYRGEVADLIATTVERWDADDTSRKLELQIGRDLQFIRINGTVVGGLAGLAIHAFAQAIG